MATNKSKVITLRLSNSKVDALEEVLRLSNSKLRETMENLIRLLQNGDLEIRNSRIILPELTAVECEYDLSNLEEACEAKGVKVQDAINKAAQMVWRG